MFEGTHLSHVSKSIFLCYPVHRFQVPSYFYRPVVCINRCVAKLEESSHPQRNKTRHCCLFLSVNSRCPGVSRAVPALCSAADASHCGKSAGSKTQDAPDVLPAEVVKTWLLHWLHASIKLLQYGGRGSATVCPLLGSDLWVILYLYRYFLYSLQIKWMSCLYVKKIESSSNQTWYILEEKDPVGISLTCTFIFYLFIFL